VTLIAKPSFLSEAVKVRCYSGHREREIPQRAQRKAFNRKERKGFAKGAKNSFDRALWRGFAEGAEKTL
jgi:hypothetical protein